jgi:toxin ParE1/3/4
MSVEPDRYKLAPRARRDLEDIWLYTFKTWSRIQADSYYDDLIAAIKALANGSRHGKPIDEVPTGYSSFLSGSHRIVYRHAGGRVLVIRILHQRINVRRHL